jgi:hypothetical protein
VKQRHPDIQLELANQPAYGRLGDVKNLGGQRHAAGSHHGAKCLDMPVVDHMLSITKSYRSVPIKNLLSLRCGIILRMT